MMTSQGSNLQLFYLHPLLSIKLRMAWQGSNFLYIRTLAARKNTHMKRKSTELNIYIGRVSIGNIFDLNLLVRSSRG